ncbi:MAG: DNA-deoxyinosine glycosylase [Solobacterium sp.]|nr:DNA-deoxyinosine glycosylase [Solobacterium sp.]
MKQAGNTGTRIVHPLKPIIDEKARVLVLGSFPSVISREEMFYYANPMNRFWSILAAVFEEEITDRKAFCLRHRIALWDVIAQCTIIGSRDESITDVLVNDIPGLIRNTGIHTIFTNGRKASELYRKYIYTDLPQITLPSTSSANARYRMDDLIREYRKIREYAEKD